MSYGTTTWYSTHLRLFVFYRVQLAYTLFFCLVTTRPIVEQHGHSSHEAGLQCHCVHVQLGFGSPAEPALHAFQVALYHECK